MPATEETIQPKRERLPVGDSLVRGVLANVSVKPVTVAASLVAATVVPHFLGSDALGQLAIAFTISGLAGTVLDLGVPTYVSRRIAQRPSDTNADLGVALTVQFGTYGLGCLVIALALRLVAPHLLVDFRILDWALISLVVGCPLSVLMAALRGGEQHLRYAWLSAGPVVISALGAAGVLFFGADVLTYTIVGVLTDVPTIAIAWKLSGLRPLRPAFTATLLKLAWRMVRGGLPFVGVSITMAVYGGIDRVLLGFMVPTHEIGWYAAAYRIIGIPVFIPTLLVTPLFPALSRSANDPPMIRRVLAQTLRITLLFTVPLAACICVFAPVVPDLIRWPADFENTVPLMRILALQLPVLGIDMVLGTVITAVGREKRWVKVGIVAAVLNVGLNLALIPVFEQALQNGPVGASIATVATELALLAGALLLTPRAYFSADLVSQAVRITAAGIAGAAAALGVLPVNAVAALFAGATVFFVLCIVLRVVSWRDVEYVRNRSFVIAPSQA